MWAHVEAQRAGDVRLTNLHGDRALIAIQGPRSVELLQPYVDADLGAMKYYSCAEARVRGGHEPVVIARTGYTGEDGFELFLPSEEATGVWDLLLAENRERGLEPCGLGARDVLRLEAGMPLYGHELTEEITPLQAGLAWAIKFDKPAFTGREALLAQREAGDYARIVGVAMEGRVPARAGYPVLAGGVRVGEIRSGSFGPAVGKNIATALVEPSAAAEGTALEVEVRGTRHPAAVALALRASRPRPEGLRARQPTVKGPMAQPAGLLYSKEHEWVKLEGDVATVGITDYAQASLGDIVYVELPRLGAELTQFGSIGVVESVKAVSDIFTPVGGEVTETNGALEGDPALVNRDPFGEGWLYKVKLPDPAGLAQTLLTPEDYDKLVAEA
jgi:glycine cleavage system H protein